MRVDYFLAALLVVQPVSAFVSPCVCGTTQAIRNGHSWHGATQSNCGATGRRPASSCTSMASSMAPEPSAGEDRENSLELPDDPEELMVGICCREVIRAVLSSE